MDVADAEVWEEVLSSDDDDDDGVEAELILLEDELDVLVGVGVVKNAAALLSSSLSAASTRSSSGHTPSLSHGFDRQQPIKAGPFRQVYQYPALPGKHCCGGISSYLSRPKPAGLRELPGQKPSSAPAHGFTSQHPMNRVELS